MMEFVRWLIFIKVVIIEEDCDDMNFSSNINEVIRAVLNALVLFFLQKDFTSTKRTKNHQKAPKA